MQKICRNAWCQKSFEITPEDLAFYEKVSPVIGGVRYDIPAPTLCPECREQRRFSFENYHSFYHRKCDITQKQIISLYAPESPYKIASQDIWWTDRVEALDYGMVFDFDRSFVDQFKDLYLSVPLLPIINTNSENCQYTNYAIENKNSYLIFDSYRCEDCFYSKRIFFSKDLVDSYDLFESELCYECSESKRLNHCLNCNRCGDSYELSYCEDCTGCHHCFGCVGLRKKEYHILNKPYSSEEYEKLVQTLKGNLPEFKKVFKILKERIPVRSNYFLSAENCSGDSIVNSSHCLNSYIINHSKDLKNCFSGGNNNSCFDCHSFDNGELQLDSCDLDTNYQVIFSQLAWYNKNCAYVISCFNSSNCFGCIGLKHKEYCILNKQYTKEEYEKLVPKIIEKMKADGEWGEFFPVSMSPFGYNETVAQEYFPLTKEEVLQRGWKWHEEEAKGDQYLGPKYEIPDDIKNVNEDITKAILLCEVTGRPYKIISQELKFYRQMGIPIPRKCPDQRHKERMALRNPRKLWDRACQKCQKAIQTTYAPDRPEIVYCESCYLKEVY